MQSVFFKQALKVLLVRVGPVVAAAVGTYLLTANPVLFSAFCGVQ